jgi:hypothetical protein
MSATGSPARQQLPKVFRPERLTDVVDVVPLVRTGEPVVLHTDRLDARDRLRAVDVANGIAAALDATVVSLHETPGVSLVPTCHQGVSFTDDLEARAALDTRPDATGTQKKSRATLCVFCELRTATVERDPPLNVLVMRDGSRARPPRIRLCRQCHDKIRNWRYAIAWCSTCEQWGRRSVNSPCGHPYGS